MPGEMNRGAAAEIALWNAPAVDHSAADVLRGAAGGAAHLLTARQLGDLQQQVQKEAYQQGFEQGFAEGRSEVVARTQRLATLLDAFAQPLQDLDQAVERELAELAVALASRLVRREIAQDREHLLATIRECLAVLPIGTRSVTVYLNPADAELLAASLGRPEERAWRLGSDAALERGDLRVASESSQVDGRLEARLRQIVLAALPDTGRV